VNELAQALTGKRFRFEMPVRWGDLDALNHVNNTVYFRYMEEARVYSLRVSGVGVLKKNRHIVLAHTSCDFLRPIVWPANLLIDMRLERVGRSSLEYHTEISMKDDGGGPCLRARNIIVGTDSETGRASPWTQAELQGMAEVFDYHGT